MSVLQEGKGKLENQERKARMKRKEQKKKQTKKGGKKKPLLQLTIPSRRGKRKK